MVPGGEKNERIVLWVIFNEWNVEDELSWACT